jgi:pimeloyl-ACP methyl ester carboxylesterase
MMQAKSGFIENGKARLYYELAGQGEPLVMIHAGVADSRQWENEFIHFAQDFSVLRYDLRGYGKSLPVDEEFSHMGDLVALLDRLNFHSPLVLIGCSLGGRLALDFALEHPSRMKALVMVGSGPSGLALDVPGHPKEAEAEQADKAGDWDLLAELEVQIWFDGRGRTPGQVNREMRRLALEMNRLALSHDARGLGKRLPDTGTPAAQRLDQITFPVLALVGEHDNAYAHAAADYLVEKVPFARKSILQDAAHLANMDHPHPFQSAVRSFLNEIES